MNKTSLLMLVVGTILGIVIGYVTFSAKPAPPEFNIEAEGFRNIGYEDGKFNIEIVKRVDDDTVDVFKKLQLPVEGFTKGLSAMDLLVDDLVERGVLEKSSDAGANDTPAQE